MKARNRAAVEQDGATVAAPDGPGLAVGEVKPPSTGRQNQAWTVRWGRHVFIIIGPEPATRGGFVRALTTPGLWERARPTGETDMRAGQSAIHVTNRFSAPQSLTAVFCTGTKVLIA